MIRYTDMLRRPTGQHSECFSSRHFQVYQTTSPHTTSFRRALFCLTERERQENAAAEGISHADGSLGLDEATYFHGHEPANNVERGEADLQQDLDHVQAQLLRSWRRG